jgi:hypothetical protein
LYLLYPSYATSILPLGWSPRFVARVLCSGNRDGVPGTRRKYGFKSQEWAMPLAHPLESLPGLGLGEPTNRREHSIFAMDPVREGPTGQWSLVPLFVGYRIRNDLKDWMAFCFRFAPGAPLRLDDGETTTRGH